jgi:hypothetical protein
VIPAGMLSFLTGLVAGAAHVVTGPDHLAALAPLAVHDREQAVRLGALWGSGHGVAVVMLGLLAQLARGVVDIEALSAWSEFLVGFLLLGMGLWALRSATRLQIHQHTHHHDGDDHVHVHVHSADAAHTEAAHRGHSHAAAAVGALHGLAGGGHLFGVLPSLALSRPQAALYLLAYLVGAVASMALFGFTVGRAAALGGPRLIRGMLYSSAAAAIIVGIWWIGSTVPSA